MVRVYECVNGHQLVPLMPSGFVKMLGNRFGHSLFVHYVVLALGFCVASAQLEKGGDLHRFTGNLDQTLCKRIASLFSPWHGHASHAIVEMFVGGNEGTPGFAQGYLSIWGFLFMAMVNLLTIFTCLLSFWEFLSWDCLQSWGFMWQMLTLPSGFMM